MSSSANLSGPTAVPCSPGASPVGRDEDGLPPKRVAAMPELLGFPVLGFSLWESSSSEERVEVLPWGVFLLLRVLLLLGVLADFLLEDDILCENRLVCSIKLLVHYSLASLELRVKFALGY